jgi:Tfp pilus assembly protein PilO
VDVSKLKAASSGEKGPYRSETVEVTVSGTYWNVVRFLTKLTEFPKILAVSSVEVEQKKTGAVGGSLLLSVKVVFDAYVLDEAKAQAKKSTPATAGSSTAGETG